MLPEKCGSCGQIVQIVLPLLDCWVNATRNDLLFIFILDEYMGGGCLLFVLKR